MIRATADDVPAIRAFLLDHIATSMFPLSNLDSYGIAGGHPRAMTFWLGWHEGQMTDAVGISDEGFVFPQCPSKPWGDVAVSLSGRLVKAIIGDAAQVTALKNALSFESSEGDLDAIDPQYGLDLANLVIPPDDGFRLAPLDAAPRTLLNAWRTAYLNEVLPPPGEDPVEKGASDIENYLQANSHRVLMAGDTPVAMTGFNANVGDTVQIGGVYTPPELRGRGHARLAVALHLAEARAAGTKNATLFAASDQASRVYQSIGFRRSGDFGLLVFETPKVAHV